MLTDAQWMVLEPLIEACCPPAKVPPQHLRRTVSAIVWRHDNGAKWRSVPPELGPWWMAAQTFIRWSRLGVWERLLTLVQEQGVQLGMTFLDATSIRAHQKAAGAAKKAALQRNGTIVKRLAGLAAAMAPRLASSLTRSAGPWPLSWHRARRTSCHMPWRCSTNCQACPAESSSTVATAATASASTSGTWVPGLRSRPSRTRRRWPARTGSTPIATKSNGSGPGSRSGAPWPRAMRKPPTPSWASSASPQPSTGSNANRP